MREDPLAKRTTSTERNYSPLERNPFRAAKPADVSQLELLKTRGPARAALEQQYAKDQLHRPRWSSQCFPNGYGRPERTSPFCDITLAEQPISVAGGCTFVAENDVILNCNLCCPRRQVAPKLRCFEQTAKARRVPLLN
uniref:Uncharacterized protein n=1 Tax=Trichuris muris TaxID=70415 RepID=A0A5S6QD39_TRIMR